MLVKGQVNPEKVYFHGCNKTENGLQIIKQGLKPGVTKESKKHGAPFANRIYFTTDIKTAITYCLGGVWMETTVPYIETSGRFGYLFSVPGQQIQHNLLPDEDCIGYIIQYIFTGEYYGDDNKNKIMSADLKWLKRLCDTKLTPTQKFNIIHNFDDFKLFAMGKKLIKFFDSEQIEQMLKLVNNVSFKSDFIVPKNIWKFDKELSPKLKKDCSNFFQLAEQLR